MTKNNPSHPAQLPRMSPQESAEYQARLDAVIALGVVQVQKEQRELVRLGILDAEGNQKKPFVPPAGQSGLHNEID